MKKTKTGRRETEKMEKRKKKKEKIGKERCSGLTVRESGAEVNSSQNLKGRSKRR
jgi:hypothetical protein